MADADETNDHFISLKEFLNSDLKEYEVIFSVSHQSNKAVEEEFAAFQRAVGGNISMVLDQPVFYRVRRTEWGFSIQRARTLGDIEEGKLSLPDQSANGVVSNVYWSANMGAVFYDPGKALETEKRFGTNWFAISCEQATKILSLGLLVRKGSLVWDGTNFEAEPVNFVRTPSAEHATRSISGNVTLSDGLPSAITYRLGSAQFVVLLDYKNPNTNLSWRIPNHLTTIDQLPSGRGSNVFTWELISLQLANFLPESTGPDKFLPSWDTLTVVSKSLDGNAKTIRFRGSPPKQPIGVKMDGHDIPNQSSSARMVVLAAMLLSSAFFLFLMLRRKNRRPTI